MRSRILEPSFVNTESTLDLVQSFSNSGSPTFIQSSNAGGWTAFLVLIRIGSRCRVEAMIRSGNTAGRSATGAGCRTVHYQDQDDVGPDMAVGVRVNVCGLLFLKEAYVMRVFAQRQRECGLCDDDDGEILLCW